jgi:hypothetical protein
MHTFFCEQQKPSPQSVANVFDQGRSEEEVKKKISVLFFTFFRPPLVLKTC